MHTMTSASKLLDILEVLMSATTFLRVRALVEDLERMRDEGNTQAEEVLKSLDQIHKLIMTQAK